MQSKSAQRLRDCLIALSIAIAPGCTPGDLSCSNSSSGGGGVVQPGLTYTTTDMRLWATAPITPNLANTNNKTAQSFAVAPALPAGLTLDVVTGTISGTPETPMTKATFVVTATFTVHDKADRSIDIEIMPGIPPSALSYTPNSVQTIQQLPLPVMTPQVTGVIETYSCSPSLPFGVQLDGATGVISGSWGGASGQFQFVVTASNPLGSATATLDFEVLPALLERGLLVSSLGDQTLDLYVESTQGSSPTDAEYLLGASPLASLQSRDGRFVYASASNGHVYRMGYDSALSTLTPPVDLGQLGTVRQIATSLDGQYLFFASDLTVTRWSVQPDGSLCCPDTAAGPFAPTAAIMVGADRLLVAGASPGEIWAYDVSLGLAQYGAPLTLGLDHRIAAFADVPRGALIDAAQQSYDMSSHAITGYVSTFRLATAQELAVGGAGVRYVQTFSWKSDLTDVSIDTRSANPSLLVSSGSSGEIGVFPTAANQTVLTHPTKVVDVGGYASQIHFRSDESVLYVLDSLAAELAQFSFLASVLEPIARNRTRGQPGALLPLHGNYAQTWSDLAFVASAADSTLLALRTSIPAHGDLGLASQGPVPTGATPVDVATSSGGPYVYTADLDGASLSAFRYDLAPSIQLTPIETELLPAGSRPNALALTRGGGFLYFVDTTGIVKNFAIDPTNGALEPGGGSAAVGGVLTDAVVRVDALSRFVFVVQPTEGEVQTLSINLPSGFALPTSTFTSLVRPVDLWVSSDGRFAYVLDAATARIVRCTIDPLDGALVPSGASHPVGTAPTRILDNTENGLAGGDGFFVLDAQSWELISLTVDPLNGALSADSYGIMALPLGTTAAQALHIPGLGLGILGATDDGQSGHLHLLDWSPPNQLTEVDTAPTGRAAHAIATSVRAF